MNSNTSIRFSLASRLFLELRINSITLSKIDNALIKQLRHILDNHDALLNVIKEELNEIKKKFKSERLSLIEAEI
ncbi:hypothetical protein INO99_17020, partial [Staphylococcus aureus]|nr:hypothetical protein [Staphylococcus aureus]